MHIFIDESGNFIAPGTAVLVSVVAALIVPEKAKRSVTQLVSDLVGSSEKKANDFDEIVLRSFFSELATQKCLAVGVAMEVQPKTASTAEAHRNGQADKLLLAKNYMEYEAGREMVQVLADQVRRLPDQLYAQLVAQLMLISQVLHNSTMFYAQHDPASLRKFRWRIDGKNENMTEYEKTFFDLAPMILQTISFDRPLVTLTDPEFNYSYMAEYENSIDNYPDHLITHANRAPSDTFNVKRMIWDNFKFEDSKNHFGIQAADLLATCTRRSIQGKFDEPVSMAKQLGRLFRRNPMRDNCIELISLQDTTGLHNTQAALAIRAMNAYSTNIF